MAHPIADPESLIRALPIWRGRIDIAPLPGGITNRNFLVTDRDRRAVVRLGEDLLLHGVMRFNEQAASRAAGEAGISPKVLYAAPNLLALDYVEGRSLAAEDVRASLERCARLVKRVHCEIAAHLSGPALLFNVFHVVRSYARALEEERNPIAPELPRLLAAAQALEESAGPFRPVFGHNDLLAANFIDDGERLWLIDWDYAGWSAALFDLGGLSSNNAFSGAENEALLELYFERPVTDELRRRFRAWLCASLLRETLWSAVQESRSTIDFDYAAYTKENMLRFAAAWAAFKEAT